jgi:hypothetical protein
MAEHKALPPIPFPPKTNQPFCLVDGDTGLVLAANLKSRDSQPLLARESTVPTASPKPRAPAR